MGTRRPATALRPTALRAPHREGFEGGGAQQHGDPKHSLGRGDTQGGESPCPQGGVPSQRLRHQRRQAPAPPSGGDKDQCGIRNGAHSAAYKVGGLHTTKKGLRERVA